MIILISAFEFKTGIKTQVSFESNPENDSVGIPFFSVNTFYKIFVIDENELLMMIDS